MTQQDIDALIADVLAKHKDAESGPVDWLEFAAAAAAPTLARQVLADAKRIEELESALNSIAALPHSNPTGDTLHGPCPKCIAEAALTPKESAHDDR